MITFGQVLNVLATSRVHSRKRSTTGLSVRFFSVTSATGHGRTGNATGSIASENLSAKRRMYELGNVAIYGPAASKLTRTALEMVSRRIFGMSMPFVYSSNPLGIGFSLFVVGLAAFNLLLDFDVIEEAARRQAPKYMEWYGAFGLMVTLIWLYLEMLRLLSKIASNRD